MDTLTTEGKEIVGSDVVTRTQSELLKNGFWKVTQTIVQKRKIEDEEEWEEKTLKMSAEAEKLETAIFNVFISIQAYLEPRNNDLFSEPEDRIPSTVFEVKDKTEDGEYIN
jgi:hypothetical protein